VVVRGHFHDLDPDARARLLAEADDHEIFKAAYTAAGTMTYEPNLVAFNFRYEMRDVSDDAIAEVEARLAEAAMTKTRASLEAMGIGHRHLRATATNMASVWDAEPPTPP
jgi:hypothetical protein